MKEIGDNGADRECQSHNIQPQLCAHSVVQIFAETELQEQGCESDGGDDHQRKRAEECSTFRVDNDEGQRKKKQTCGYQSPATRVGDRGRIGSAVGQGSAQRYTRTTLRVSNREWRCVVRVTFPSLPVISGARQSAAGAGQPLCVARLAIVECVEDQLDAAGNAQLLEYPKEILLHCVLAEIELAGDVPIA